MLVDLNAEWREGDAGGTYGNLFEVDTDDHNVLEQAIQHVGRHLNGDLLPAGDTDTPKGPAPSFRVDGVYEGEGAELSASSDIFRLEGWIRMAVRMILLVRDSNDNEPIGPKCAWCHIWTGGRPHAHTHKHHCRAARELGWPREDP